MQLLFYWIPAYAGMTVGVGMTDWSNALPGVEAIPCGYLDDCMNADII